jgi:hypothetical protein
MLKPIIVVIYLFLWKISKKWLEISDGLERWDKSDTYKFHELNWKGTNILTISEIHKEDFLNC